jgi:hypothetical protein
LHRRRIWKNEIWPTYTPLQQAFTIAALLILGYVGVGLLLRLPGALLNIVWNPLFLGFALLAATAATIHYYEVTKENEEKPEQGEPPDRRH